MINNRDELRQDLISQTLSDRVSEAVQLKSTELTFVTESKVAAQKQDLEAMAEALCRREKDLIQTVNVKISEVVQVKLSELTSMIESRVAGQKNHFEALAESLRHEASDLNAKLGAMGDLRQDLVQTLSDKFC